MKVESVVLNLIEPDVGPDENFQLPAPPAGFTADSKVGVGVEDIVQPDEG